MPFHIVCNDITRMEVDAVVNAANEQLRMGGGVCGAIFQAAGAMQLQRECDEIGYCPTGQAVITKGYALPAGRIIHTVGPVWRGGGQNEAALLESCYRCSLKLAAESGCHSIAFPLISSGIYGYPQEEALRIAVEAIGRFLGEQDMTVYLVVFDRRSFSIGEERYRAIASFIDHRYTEGHTAAGPRPLETKQLRDSRRAGTPSAGLAQAPAFPQAGEGTAQADASPVAMAPAASLQRLEDVVSRLDESFSQMLLRLIDERGKSDVEIYKRANVDRKLFSKIRGNPAYKPSKATALAFAIALELELDETRDLLGKAGYALSHSSKFDVIIEYFIENRIYNIFEINEALFAFDQTPLGA